MSDHSLCITRLLRSGVMEMSRDVYISAANTTDGIRLSRAIDNGATRKFLPKKG